MASSKDFTPDPSMTLEQCLNAPELLPDQIRKITKYAKELLGAAKFTKCIQSAVRDEQSRLAMEEYRKKISEPVVYQELTAEQLKSYFIREFKAQHSVDFVEDEYSIPVLERLCLYFANDERFEMLDDDYSLSKGLVLHGVIGCGKSSWMRIFQTNQKCSFQFKSCSQVAREFSKEGYKTLEKYFSPIPNVYRSQFFGQQELGWCFDDLGFEQEAKHYGKASNVMVELIQAIYDKPAMKGMVHFTTNLSANQIGDNYGSRIRSRMRELFNVISYASEAPDRRR